MHVFFLHNKKKTSRTEWQTINLPYQILFDLREQTRTSLVTMHVFFLHNKKKTSRAADRRLIDWRNIARNESARSFGIRNVVRQCKTLVMNRITSSVTLHYYPSWYWLYLVVVFATDWWSLVERHRPRRGIGRCRFDDDLVTNFS